MNAATNALTPNLILYLMNEYHMDMTTGSNILYIWSATTNIAPVLAAFLADSFVGRFKMIGLGSVVTLVVKFMLFNFLLLTMIYDEPYGNFWTFYICILVLVTYGNLSFGIAYLVRPVLPVH